MMTAVEEIAFALALPLLTLTTQAVHSIHSRLGCYFRARCVERIAAMMVAEEDPSDDEVQALRLRFSAGVIADSVSFVAEHIYGVALNRLLLVVEVSEVDFHLLDSVRISRREHRAHHLSRLANLMPTAVVAEGVKELLEDENRDIAFYALAVQVASSRDGGVRDIARFDSPLTRYELSVLTRLLHRAEGMIAYTPLLISQNRNLQLLGISLAERFSIIDAESHLQELLAAEDVEIAYSALQALCAIGGDISTDRVGVVLARVQPYLRAAFLRNVVRFCYSPHSCESHLSHEERKALAQRIESYKCQIVCN